VTEEWVVVIDNDTGEPFDECWEDGTLLIRSQRPKLGSGCLPFFVEMCVNLPALIVFTLGLLALLMK
jgi:hypothetical protein